jgi:alcohol dehydrogenase YqhD (iron-dependent ADH family)
MKYVYRHNIHRFVQFAVRVWNVEEDFFDPEATALEGIRRTKEFFRSIGLPVTLRDLEIPDDRLEEMAEKCKKGPDGTVGQFVKLTTEDVLNILKLAK